MSEHVKNVVTEYASTLPLPIVTIRTNETNFEMADKFNYGAEERKPLFTTAGAALCISIASFGLWLFHILTSS